MWICLKCSLLKSFSHPSVGAGSLATTAMLSVSTEKSQRGISLDIVLGENKFSL